MWNIEKILRVKNELAGKKKEMEAVRDKLSVEITRIEADGTRHADWKREKTAEARGKAMSALGPSMRYLSEQAAPVGAQSRFWESRSLLLAQQKFDEDPAKDSAVRQRYMAELNALSHDELHLVAANARDDNNLPLLWQAHLAGRRLADVKGATGVDVSDVNVPGQAEALQAIRDCGALVAGGEFIVGQTSGRLTPTQKLQFARGMQSSENDVRQTLNYGRSDASLEKPNAELQGNQQET
jgi:hypothetical protein